MDVRDDRSYTSEHEWVLTIDGGVRVGITDYAQDALGDVVFVDLPDEGLEVVRDQTVAEVESTKSVGEIYAPVPGSVTRVNGALAGSPELINSDPYGEGWIFELAVPSDAATDHLLDPATYRALIED